MPSPRGLLESYLLERSLYVSESTVWQDRLHLNRFFQFLDERGVNQVGSITFQELDDYGHHLETVPGKRGRTASPAYKNKALQVSLFFLNWSSCRGHTLVDFSCYQLPQKARMKPVGSALGEAGSQALGSTRLKETSLANGTV